MAHSELAKRIGLGLGAYLPLTLLASFAPDFSAMAAAGSSAVLLVGLIGFAFAKDTRRLARLAAALAWPGLLFIAGIRWLSVGSSSTLLLFVSLFPLLVFAVLLPKLSATASHLLWQEQHSPRTELGQMLWKIASWSLPTLGALAAIIGIYGSRAGLALELSRIAGALMLLASILLAQAFSHQLGIQRPSNSPMVQSE